MEEIADVVERHDHDDDATQNVHGLDALARTVTARTIVQSMTLFRYGTLRAGWRGYGPLSIENCPPLRLESG